MNLLFWERAHGGLTHFPIALVFIAALFDLVAYFRRRFSGSGENNRTGYWLIVLAGFGAVGAAISGLVLSKWKVGGAGLLFWHHLFVWPALVVILALAVWRVAVRNQLSLRAFKLYLALLFLACGLVSAAGFVGGEMLLGNTTLSATAPPLSAGSMADAAQGRHLFLMNCAHCHGDDARGDEGPDLHDLHKTDARIHQVITGGIKGEMPAFAKKLGEPEIRQLTAYVRTLRG